MEARMNRRRAREEEQEARRAHEETFSFRILFGRRKFVDLESSGKSA